MIFKKETELFKAIKINIVLDLEESQDTFAHYDCYSTLHNIDIELKCRRSHYDDLLIERKKFKALIDRSKKFGTHPVYINSTPKGVWSFRLLDLKEPQWEGRTMPKDTDFNSIDLIVKEVGYYNINQGTNISNYLQ
tara:strand:+ start:16835 stop:17242 length:408 start_codon:yes stop_codon:yes gene_type:complete